MTEIETKRHFAAIANAVGLDPTTSYDVIHACLNGEADLFGVYEYSVRMLAFRDATDDAFAAAGVTVNSLVLERATGAAYYSACGTVSLAPVAAESIAAAVAAAAAA